VDQIVMEKAKGEYFLPVEMNGSAQKMIAKRHAVNMFPGLVQNGQSISGLLRTVEPCDNNAGRGKGKPETRKQQELCKFVH